MSSKYNVGDRVSFVNEKETGTIIEVARFRVIVEKDNGFKATISIDEIVPLSNDTSYKIDIRRIAEKDLNKKLVSKPKTNEIWEIDLHLSEIDTNRVVTDHEKLLAQLKYFHKCMDAAIHQKIKKIIFIHGIGKGTLKQEVLFALKKYEKVKYYDASFKQYGRGATVVEMLNS